MLQVTPSISFLIENVLVALLIIIYLAYEIRLGRGQALASKLNGLVEVTVAIARENPNIDEERVADRLNGDAPSQFQDDDH
ncbi:hypothetical protein [Haloarcula sp. 1CSR25-25]|uniref:hypothetical protein n=1 Tax=Haloarcula sp. 1CSR25-25 TaxID=2862545 RepID=UPI0028939E40|nr:hypothetical protein [Haloarcula sp. 1CSR25-25]MDT3434703.1 hypothetical protein [Haloarcula sp. 1CSR25-25]